MTSDLETILRDLEHQEGAMNYRNVGGRFEEALKAVGDVDHPQKQLLRAEYIGFSFTEGTGDRKNRSTYFGPEFSMQDDQGNEREFPLTTCARSINPSHCIKVKPCTQKTPRIRVMGALRLTESGPPWAYYR
jgi:hypothetical protein